MTQPMTPVDCDLQDSKYMPIYVQQLLNSSFNAMLDDTAWRAGVTLWFKSWHQVPAASLPDDDEELCGLAGFGRDLKGWRKVRAKALRGWQLCDDGRLYHAVIAEAALEAWISALLGRISSGNGNAKRWGTTFDPSDIERQIGEAYPLLRSLNANAEAVKKIDRRNAKDAKQDATGKPGGTPDVIPVGSQRECEGEVTTREEFSSENPSLSVAGESEGAKIDFEDFRRPYPKFDGLNAARKDWNAAIEAGANPQSILDGLAKWSEEWDRRIGNPKINFQPEHIPGAGRFLSEEWWLNAPEPAGGTHTSPRPENIPEGLWDMVVAERDEDFAKSFLAQCTVGENTLTTRTGMAVEKLRTVSCLSDFKITQRRVAA